MSNALKFAGAVGTVMPVGQQEYTTPGTYSWTCPAGVTSVSVVCIGSGHGKVDCIGYGGGGGLGYKNNMPVIEGNSYTVVVGARNTATGVPAQDSYFMTNNTSNTYPVGKGGGTNGVGALHYGDGGGNGGNNNVYSGGAGSGAGGYSGNGGNGGYTSTDPGGAAGDAGIGGGGGGGGNWNESGNMHNSGGGGVGIYGQGSNGAGGTASSSVAIGGGGGSGGTAGQTTSVGAPAYGGGYGGGGAPAGGDAGQGAVRIIWPGNLRQFPSTRTANE